MAYSAPQLAGILKTNFIQNTDNEIEYLITDSRRINFPASSLFIALVSGKRDGHVFIPELIERGVKNFLVQNNYDASLYPFANFIFANNTLTALQQLAAYHRSQFNYPVIAITGSNGKTIVKEWLYQLLNPNYNIVRSPRSYNSQIGVPLSVWQMKKENNLAIFEAGISMVNEMQALKKIIQPTIGVLTNIGDAHHDGFSSDNALKLSEKIKLFTHCNILIGRQQDLGVQKNIGHQSGSGPAILTWGTDEGNTFIISNPIKQNECTLFTINYQKLILNLVIPFTDNASVENAVTCACVLLNFGLDKQEIEKRMRLLQPVDMRLQLIHGLNNCVLINDSYSFDINSFSIGLDFLLQQQQHSQKTVIISEIPSAQNEAPYQEVTAMLQAKNIERVITIGSQWGFYKDLLKNKIAITEHYSDTELFIKHFSINQFRNEAILLKGARVFQFEKIVALLEKKVHQTVMEINLTAMVHNLNVCRNNLAPGVKIMAMVKAAGYGSGSTEVANLLQFHKVDYLAVAYTDEGVELRKAGIHLPIMVLNIDEAAFETLVEYNLEPELFSPGIFKAFISFLDKQCIENYPVHIKLDTGMHRLGFEAENLEAVTNYLKKGKHIFIKSVFSHLASSDDVSDDEFTSIQVNKFVQAFTKIKEITGYSFMKHISNSAAIFRMPHLQFDMVRIGIGLYGIDSSKQNQHLLQNVITLKTTIAQLRLVKAGDTVGYNRRGKVLTDSLIATLRIGYADGFRRSLSNGIGKVFIHDKLVPVIGSVSMDMIMVDVSGIEKIKEGDPVEIFGNNLPVQDFATMSGTIPYEIFTSISQRVKRVYVEE